MILQCEGEETCDIHFDHVNEDCLRKFLSVPKRSMAALLHRKKLKSLDKKRFFYQSRPYKILGYEIRPEVVFLAIWDGDSLNIDFESCRINGLSGMSNALEFTCNAVIVPKPSRLSAQAKARFVLQKTKLTTLIPDAVLLKLGSKALAIVFARLEDRCQRRLHQAVVQWLAHES